MASGVASTAGAAAAATAVAVLAMEKAQAEARIAAADAAEQRADVIELQRQNDEIKLQVLRLQLLTEKQELQQLQCVSQAHHISMSLQQAQQQVAQLPHILARARSPRPHSPEAATRQRRSSLPVPLVRRPSLQRVSASEIESTSATPDGSPLC
jgi:hypothetical protein